MNMILKLAHKSHSIELMWFQSKTGGAVAGIDDAIQSIALHLGTTPCDHLTTPLLDHLFCVAIRLCTTTWYHWHILLPGHGFGDTRPRGFCIR